MSQLSEFQAQVRSELLSRHASSLGWCVSCGEPVLVEENSMRVEGRVAHVNCRRPSASRDDQVEVAKVRWAPERPAAPRAPRARIALTCVLRRRAGSPIAAETIELGPEGMRVTAQRPLAADETVSFDFPDLKMRAAGVARVLRQQRPNVYVLRFERLPDRLHRCLHALATRQSHSDPG